MSKQAIIRSIDGVDASEVARAQGTRIQILLGPDDQMPNFYTRRFTIEPGGSIPLHRHDRLEHEQVVLEGEMLLQLDGKDHTVRAGDCVYIPAQVAHAYQNPGPVPVRFLCMVPAIPTYQTEWLDGSK